MYSNAFSSRKIFLFLKLMILSNRTSFAQSITAITQAPGFSSLSSCAQSVAKAVIDDSTSPECPAGSPPSCFCKNEGLSKEWSDQISTDVLNSCLTSSRPQATSAASVFSAYCSAGEGAAAASTTTTDEGSDKYCCCEGVNEPSRSESSDKHDGSQSDRRLADLYYSLIHRDSESQRYGVCILWRLGYL